ncbi:MAG: glutamate racemase [bacterium]
MSNVNDQPVYGDQSACCDKPIGIFDSGVGGLTVVREIINILPYENIIYLGDTARVPYGVKSRDTVTRYAFQTSRFLLTQGVKVIVIACNTASAFALGRLRDHFSLPCLGVIEPGVRVALKNTMTGRIGIIGTAGTISSQAYVQAMKAINPDVEIFSQPCPLFVSLVEEALIEHSVTYQVAQMYLEPLIQKRIDTLILGCTHYPLLKKVISDIMGPGVALVDSAISIALELKTILAREELSNPQKTLGEHRFFVTDTPEQFQKLGKLFLQQKIFSVEHVDICSYDHDCTNEEGECENESWRTCQR